MIKVRKTILASNRLINLILVAIQPPVGLLCTKKYSLHTITPHLTISGPSRSETSTVGMTCACQAEHAQEIGTVGLDQCIKTATVQICTNNTHVYTATIHSTKFVYKPTTVHVSICPSPTNGSNSKPMLTKTITISSYKDNSYQASSSSPSSTFPPASKEVAMLQILLNIATPATAALMGLLIVLLLVVIIGWVCTCQTMKKRGKMKINIMQDRYYLLCRTA